MSPTIFAGLFACSVELVDDGLPCIPHHHDAQMLPADKAVALVECVRGSAEKHAVRALDDVARAARNVAYRARNVADWVMYRRALARAAKARGWAIIRFDWKRVVDAASRALGRDFDRHFRAMRDTLGAPWNADHKLAMAAASAACEVRG
jgi:hypothetical protein